MLPSAAEPTLRSQSRFARLIGWIAGSIATIVAVSLPAGFFWLSYSAQITETTIAARLHAAFVTQAIVASQGDWRREVGGLIDLPLTPTELPEARLIRDHTGSVVTHSEGEPQAPTLTRHAELVGRDGPVGRIEVVRSLVPLLVQTAVVAALGIALGLAIFVTLRVLPLNALRRTLAALERQQQRALREAEQQLRIVFEHSVEGILTFSPDGCIATCNPAASKLFGVAADALAGRRITTLIEAPPGWSGTDCLPLRQWESTARRVDAPSFPVELTVSETMVTGERQLIGIVRDITERKLAQDRLAFLANYDSLTGLPNRSLFRDRLAQAMERARRSGRTMALLFLDLDHFKTINDSLGHDVGDRLLQHVAQALRTCLRKADTVARNTTEDFTVSRLGGDEFTVIAENLDGPAAAQTVAQRLIEALHQPFSTGTQEIFVSTSVGITIFPLDETDLDGLIKHADIAMYRSKELGRNTYHFYSADLNAHAVDRLRMEGELRHALERNEFVLYYQPKADLRSGRITGVEALLRWNRPGVGLTAPASFIPLLEDIGLIVPVGDWVLRTACRQAAVWQQAGLPPLRLAVNLSARQFKQQDIGAAVSRVLFETGLDASRLELELTESMLMEDSEASAHILKNLVEMGTRVAIDDFGTGYSSLSYLKRFNVHTLKIDRSFVRDIPDDPDDCAIGSAVIALARSLRLRVVAEGVESEAQLAFLRDQGCDEFQGYLLSRPLPAAEFERWIARAPELPARTAAHPATLPAA
jgi:diguanylate cyclase (GGDEF)-like protein/PAS domain S-box-containing protein